MTVSPERIEEALRRLRNKRRLGSFYLADVDTLAAALRVAQDERDEAREIVERLRRHGADWVVDKLREEQAEHDRLRRAVEEVDRYFKQVMPPAGTPWGAVRAALAVSPPADEAKLDGPYRIVLDFDGTEVVWSSMYAHEREFRIRAGAESIERQRADEPER